MWPGARECQICQPPSPRLWAATTRQNVLRGCQCFGYTHILLSAHCNHGPIWEKFYHHLCYCHVLSSEMIKMKVNFMHLKFLIIHFYFDQEMNFYFMLSFKFTVCSFQISSWSCQSGPICFWSEVFDVDWPVSNCPKWKHFFTITIELCQAWSSSWVGISVIRNLTTDS